MTSANMVSLIEQATKWLDSPAGQSTFRVESVWVLARLIPKLDKVALTRPIIESVRARHLVVSGRTQR